MTYPEELKAFLEFASIGDVVSDLRTLEDATRAAKAIEESETGFLEHLYYAQNVGQIIGVSNRGTDATLVEYVFTLGRLFEIRRRQQTELENMFKEGAE